MSEKKQIKEELEKVSGGINVVNGIKRYDETEIHALPVGTQVVVIDRSSSQVVTIATYTGYYTVPNTTWTCYYAQANGVVYYCDYYSSANYIFGPVE